MATRDWGLRRLGELGWTVFLGSRDAERGRAAAGKLAADGVHVAMVPLDVTSDASVAAAVQMVRCVVRVLVGLRRHTITPRPHSVRHVEDTPVAPRLERKRQLVRNRGGLAGTVRGPGP